MTPSQLAAAPPDLSVVVCTLNEAEAIGPLLVEIGRALGGLDYEVVVVDDSPDALTVHAAEAERGAVRRLTVIHRREGRGLASAAIEGWEAAQGRLLALMDGDGQHDPATVRTLAALLDDGACDLALASRYLPGQATGLSRGRHALSRLATVMARPLLGAAVTDPMSGCFVMRRAVFEAARPRLAGVGFKILADVVASAPRGLRVRETPAALRPRMGGASKLDARVAAELGAMLLEKRTYGLVPARMALFGAVGLMGVGVNLLTLGVVERLGAPFWAAQAAALAAAMIANFFSNNLLTFRDRRLSGRALGRGLLAFTFACSGGALVNEGAASILDALGAGWLASAVAGAAAGALWNYNAARRAVWRAAPVSAEASGVARPTREPAIAAALIGVGAPGGMDAPPSAPLAAA